MSFTTTTAVSPSFSVIPPTSHPTSSQPRAKSRRRLTRLQEGTCRFMDTSSACLSQLSSELLTLICAQLEHTDRQTLYGLRRVDRRFGAIATPFVFRTLVLNSSLVHEHAAEVFSEAFNLIERYTRHVVVRGDLQPHLVRGFLRRTGKLLTITWRFGSDHLEVGGTWLPSDVLDIERMKRDGTRLFIEELPMRRFAGDSYNRAIPANLVTSLKLARPTPPLTTHLASLKNLLIQAKSLESLHYQDRGQGTQFAFREGERLPPLKDLRLRSYDWDHSASDVREHWDFSELRSLELDSVPCLSFLSSIDFGNFKNLRSLHLEDWSLHRPHGREEATRLLGTWVKDHLRGLKSLKLTCHIKLFPISAVLAHSDSLEVLKLRDHVGFRDDHQPCPLLSPTDLRILAKRLKWVHTLTIDWDPREFGSSELLGALLPFHRLDALTLHTQSIVGASRLRKRSSVGASPHADIDYETALDTFAALNSQRFKNGIKMIGEITVNMGDWKPIMVRRLGARWRALNERGIFAERCFVMKRVGGEPRVWEEKAIETASPRATPDPMDFDEEEDEYEDEEEDA